MLESWILYVNYGTPVISNKRQELIWYDSHILNFRTYFNVVDVKLDKIVGFNLDQRLFVKEVFEVAVDQVEGRGVRQVAV